MRLDLLHGSVYVWICASVRGCVFLSQGVHSSGCGLSLPVCDSGRCEVRVTRAGWSCFLSDWSDWLLLGNSQALRCHGAWKREMSHPSLPTGETSSLSPGPGFTRSHKEALPSSLHFQPGLLKLILGVALKLCQGCCPDGTQSPLGLGGLRPPLQAFPVLHWSGS